MCAEVLLVGENGGVICRKGVRWFCREEKFFYAFAMRVWLFSILLRKLTLWSNYTYRSVLYVNWN